MGPDLEIKIATRADLKGARDLEASLKSQIAALKRLGQDASAAESQLKKVQASIKGAPAAGGGLGRMADGLKRIREQGGAAASAINGMAGLISGPIAAGVAVFAAIASALRGVSAAVNEYAGAQERVTQLDAALAQQGQLTDEVREKYQALAGELQRATAIADDEWLGVLARLTQFGSNPDSVGMDVEAVKNLAGLLNGDLQQAALMVGKAIQGNFTAFSRWGIAVEENAAQAQKLDQLYRELAARGGGQLEARAKTLNGEWRALKNSTSDLMEAFGGMIARTGILQGATRILSDAFEFWAETLSDTIPAVDGLTNAQRKTLDVQEELEASTRRYEKRMEDAKRAADRFAEGLARVRGESEAIRRRQDEQNDARMALELAIVDDQEKRGLIQGPGAISRRAGIREKYALKREALALENDLKQIQVNGEELRAARLRENATKAEISALEARRAAAAGYNQSRGGKLDTLVASLDERIAGLTQAQQAIREASGSSLGIVGLAAGTADSERLQRELGVAQAYRNRFAKEREALGGTPENVALIDAELARARGRLAGENDELARLEAATPFQNGQIAADAESRWTADRTRAAAEAIQSGQSGAGMGAAVAAARGLHASVNGFAGELARELEASRRKLEMLQSQIRNANR